jgi:hypothetical protein
MKTTVEHPVYGTITYDSGTKKVTVQKGNLAERLTWLMNHPDELSALKPGGYYPNVFLRACEMLGIIGGDLKVRVDTTGEANLPDDATY